jgi:hypothetical protein
MEIRPATDDDEDAIWAILEPVLRVGETYALPRDWSRRETLAFWRAPAHAVFVAQEAADHSWHLLSAPQPQGRRRPCRQLRICHPSAGAGTRGCPRNGRALAGRGQATGLHGHAVQFRALWTKLGFEVVGRLPRAFRHPERGLVDALVMHRML